ncbi:MAG: diaminopimelate epimerase [Planctomycetes bacterium]|nr:diaminopimelate epimerase [Planctomycetota bacterium]
MPLEFTKLHGAGNDYLLVDGFAAQDLVDRGPATAVLVADRRFGVGSDGLIVVGPSDVADVRMHMWNADGSRGAMCGNGLRLVARFAVESGRVASDVMLIETDAGVFEALLQRDPDGEILGARVGMPPVVVDDRPSAIVVDGKSHAFWRASVGNPHAVIFVAGDPEQAPLQTVGPAMQRHPLFAGGVNVEMVAVHAPDLLVQRTFERGSGETWACGSGAVASAMVALHTTSLAGERVRVRMRGGEVVVHRIDRDRAELEGPAVRVFQGVFGA